MIYIISTILFLFANIIFVTISYNNNIRLHEYNGFVLGYIASLSSMTGWYLLVKNVNYNNIFFVDLVWEIGTTLISVLLPLIFFNIQVNFIMYIGIFLCFVGLLVIKLGEIYK